MVAQVAALEPDTAAKIVQPIILVCSKRPGKRFTHGTNPLNMSSDNLVRNSISPIHINSGSAVSVHDEADPHTVTAIASPTGRAVNSAMPNHATPSSPMPIHTPQPSRINNAAISGRDE